MSAYKGFTKAQEEAHRRYIKQRATIQLIMKEEDRDAIKTRAAGLGLSVNQYILGLVKRDLAGE